MEAKGSIIDESPIGNLKNKITKKICNEKK